MTNAWYCTREDVSGALDVKSTARDNDQIDREIEAASRGVEQLLHRFFAPTLDTRYKNWPNNQMGQSWTLWLDDDELISDESATTVVSGGVTLASSQFFLEPQANPSKGRPFNRIEINLAGPAAFSSGSTFQRSIAISGLFGYSDDAITVGTTVGTFLIGDTIVNLVDQRVGVGTVLKIGSERVICTDRGMTDAGRVLAGDLSASAADSLVLTDGATIYPGEVLLVDSEQMLVTDTAGDNLVVKRAWSGTTLASHNTSASIYAQRAFTVQRGALGTVPAEHDAGSVWTAWVVPGPVRQLCIAEVLNTFGQEQSGYARTVGSGDSARNASGGGIEDARMTAYNACGRKARSRAV